MISLDRLRYFVAAAELEHVGRAAKLLFVSPSVVSDAISVLESEFECKLFLRERKSMRLNSNGKSLLIKAREILKSIEKLRSEVTSGSGSFKGQYSIGASHFLLRQFLVPAVLEIRKDYPDLVFEVRTMDTSLAVTEIENNRLDFAFVFRSAQTKVIDEKVLEQDQFKIIVRNRHPLINMSKAQLASKLSSYPAITFRPALGASVWETHPALTYLGIRSTHGFYYDDNSVAEVFLRKTNGWAFMPSITLKHFKSLRALPLDIQAPVNISLINSRKNRHSPIFDLIASYLKLGFSS